MRARGAWTAAMALGSLLSTGCENAHPCEGACPRIDEEFVVQAGAPLGACPFDYVLPPASLPLAPSRDGRQVALTLVDANGHRVPLVADVLIPEDGESTALLSGFVRTARAAALGEDRPLELQVRLDARIRAAIGGQRISGTVSTWSWPEGEPTGCQTAIPFEGTAKLGR